MKKFTLLICQGMVLLFSLMVGCNIKEEEIIETVPTVTTEQSIPPPPITPKPLPTPEQRRPYEYDASLSLKEKEKMVEECNSYVSYLNYFVWDVDKDDVILDTEEVIELYLEDIGIWKEKVKEYPVAATVWRWATEEKGYSEYVAAGIIGNMMVEVGGHTMDLKHMTRVGKYFGLCMWYFPYSPEVDGKSLRDQLNFLGKTMEKNMGSAHYQELLNSRNEKEASIIFAMYYERCVRPYGRQSEASRAYRYFTS